MAKYNTKREISLTDQKSGVEKTTTHHPGNEPYFRAIY